MDVWNSRPLDVHRWSDYPEVNVFIDELWSIFTSAYHEHVAVKRGKKPKGKPKNQFKVLLLDLFVCWSEDTEQCIGVSRNVNDYVGVDSRYNKLHISKLIIRLCDQLIELGWLELAKGSFTERHSRSNRTSRIKPTEFLVQHFRVAKFGIDAIGIHADRESLILTAKTYDLDPLGNEIQIKEAIPYQDTTQTNLMRSVLIRYNDLLQQTHIDIRDLDLPIIERVVQTKNGPELRRVKVNQANKFVRRIFSDSSWESHGRFYGGFWQQIDEATRARIFIDHHETIEVDFKALHVCLLYTCFVKEPLPYGYDPYMLTAFNQMDESNDILRSRVKRLVLQAINASSRASAYAAFRNEVKAGNPEKRLKNNELDSLLEAFLTDHPKLRPYICKGLANELMYIDGNITANIINRLTHLQIPVLTIHDSYIVKLDDYVKLRQAMHVAASSVIGEDLFSEQELMHEERPMSNLHAPVLERHLSFTSFYWISEEYSRRYRAWCDQVVEQN